MRQSYLFIDYETRSECDLRKQGAWEYSKHSTTEILCVSWCVAEIETKNGKKKLIQRGHTKSWSPFLQKRMPKDLHDLLFKHNMPVIAHNAGFEQAITRNVLPRYTN